MQVMPLKGGTKHLINDSADSASIKAYRAAQILVVEKPKFTSTTRSGADIVITWTGTAMLQAADDGTGQWTDVAGATSPRTTTPSAAHKFYRLKQ